MELKFDITNEKIGHFGEALPSWYLGWYGKTKAKIKRNNHKILYNQLRITAIIQGTTKQTCIIN